MWNACPQCNTERGFLSVKYSVQISRHALNVRSCRIITRPCSLGGEPILFATNVWFCKLFLSFDRIWLIPQSRSGLILLHYRRQFGHSVDLRINRLPFCPIFIPNIFEACTFFSKRSRSLGGKSGRNLELRGVFSHQNIPNICRTTFSNDFCN